MNKQINKYLYCNERHLFSALFLFWLQWYTGWVFMFGIYLVLIYIYIYINSKDRKLHLNSYYKFGNICIRIPPGIVQFYPHLSLETVFPALKLTQIYWINMKTDNLITNWLPLCYTNTLKDFPQNLTKYESIAEFENSNFSTH